MLSSTVKYVCVLSPAPLDHDSNYHHRMQFKSLFVLAVSLVMANADYIVGNCGDASGTALAATEKACSVVNGQYCGAATGVGRCVVDKAEWASFQQGCPDKTFQRPGSYDKSTAEKIALC